MPMPRLMWFLPTRAPFRYQHTLHMKQTFDRLQTSLLMLSHPDRPRQRVRGNSTAWWQFFTAVLCKKRLRSRASALVEVLNLAPLLFPLPSTRPPGQPFRRPSTPPVPSAQLRKQLPQDVNLRSLYIDLCARLPAKIMQFPDLKLTALNEAEKATLSALEAALPPQVLNSLRQVRSPNERQLPPDL